MIELIAMHIPKTAGQSFHDILCGIYGERLFHVNVNPKFPVRYNNRSLKDVIPEDKTVLHGHFKFGDIEEVYRESGARLVVWLRDPVERVVSNYYFARRKIRCGARPNEVSRKDDTLLDYARRKDTMNRMSGFLEGIALGDIFFAGLLECFDSDIEELGELLGWKNIRTSHKNSNAAYRAGFAPPTEEEIEEIKRLNAGDVELYEEAVRLRGSRRKMAGGSA